MSIGYIVAIVMSPLRAGLGPWSWSCKKFFWLNHCLSIIPSCDGSRYSLPLQMWQRLLFCLVSKFLHYVSRDITTVLLGRWCPIMISPSAVDPEVCAWSGSRSCSIDGRLAYITDATLWNVAQDLLHAQRQVFSVRHSDLRHPVHFVDFQRPNWSDARPHRRPARGSLNRIRWVDFQRSRTQHLVQQKFRERHVLQVRKSGRLRRHGNAVP